MEEFYCFWTEIGADGRLGVLEYPALSDLLEVTPVIVTFVAKSIIMHWTDNC